MVTCNSVMLYVEAFILCIICFFSILFRFVCDSARGSKLWHTAELPGQITANSETEEGESQWHLEEEAPMDKIHHACRCGLQLGRVDHKQPQQGNRWR